ncbi:hypothetical protein H8B15_17780 [Hymenobacter sp. BT507]|uniref:Uncharacterized protein n=1 Tax=Hymenobacter citatus TaxID=2763506 RepID=A0ABR7MQG7_9BACT|nr:hypothetical protein [Hymenobacter citatus]MBC6612778.1 hypothetical protein [Hymenobacter citatus]
MALLDGYPVAASGFPTAKMPVLSKALRKGAQGNEMSVLTAQLATLQLGPYQLKQVLVQLLTTNKPLPGKNMHLLGNEVLKRFKVLLDLQQNIVYLKPNYFYTADFMDYKEADA